MNPFSQPRFGSEVLGIRVVLHFFLVAVGTEINIPRSGNETIIRYLTTNGVRAAQQPSAKTLAIGAYDLIHKC